MATLVKVKSASLFNPLTGDFVPFTDRTDEYLNRIRNENKMVIKSCIAVIKNIKKY